jgi:hypothetical protein
MVFKLVESQGGPAGGRSPEATWCPWSARAPRFENGILVERPEAAA